MTRHMNKYILGLALIFFLGAAFFAATPSAKASDLDWGLTITIPGNHYDRRDHYQPDARLSCRTIRLNHERAMNKGRYRQARHWENRWHANGCDWRRRGHAHNYDRRYDDRREYYHRDDRDYYRDEPRRRH